MKRLTIALLLALVATSASAQLNVKSESEVRSIATATSSMAVLAHSDKFGYVMAIKSNNRFDKSGSFILGDEPDGAIKTLQDLLELCETIGDQMITVESSPGRECIISASRKKGWLRMKFERHAGVCELRDKDIEEFIKAIDGDRD